MRFRFSLVATATLTISSLALTAASGRAQTPTLSGTAGSGSNTYYFVMDFRDFSAPQSYAFTYLSNASTLSFETILKGLATIPTYSATIATGSTFGDSLNGLAYAGKTKFNDFAGNNSGQPNGYWDQWTSLNGIGWSEDQVGITNQTINAGQYIGASWTGDYNTIANAAPRTPFATGAAATPEPGAFALLAVSALPLLGAAVRRRKCQSHQGDSAVK